MRQGIALIVFAFLAGASWGYDAELTWTPPTAREDGLALDPAEIAGYELQASLESSFAIVDAEATAPGGTASSFTWSAFSDVPGLYYFRARTVDTEGLVSTWSNIAQRVFKGNPNPPGQLDAKRKP